MNREEFLTALREGLTGLPQEDIDRSVDFYSEMIADSIEDGLSEADAAAAVGSVREIIAQIWSEAALPKPENTNIYENGNEKQKRVWKAWEIVLLVLGSPVWLPLVLTAFLLLLVAALLALMCYLLLWCIVVIFYAADLVFAAGAVAGIFGSLAYFPLGNVAGGILFIGAGLVCAGIAILLFFGCNQVAKGTLVLGQKLAGSIRTRFRKKEAVQ